MKKLSEENRTTAYVVILAIVGVSAAHADAILPSIGAPTSLLATGNIQQVSSKGAIVNGNWVETVVLKNNGSEAANGLIVTSWPYNDKDLVDPNNPKGPRKDSATQAEPGAQFAQQKSVDIPAGGNVTVTFTYMGADAKPWKNYYIDVYSGRINVNNRVFGTAASYAFAPIAPGQGGTFAVDFQRPYPAALIGSDIFSPALFSVAIVDFSLPSGWALSSFGPLTYELAADGSAPFTTLMQASFTANETNPGETAFLDYDAVLRGTDQHWLGEIGVQVVPEPSSMLAIAIIFSALCASRIRGRTPVRTRRLPRGAGSHHASVA